MKLLTFAILILCFSCTCVKERKIELDFDKKIEYLEYSKIADSLKYIHLETNKESLVGRIDQLYKDDELIFILDRKQKSVFIFNESGQYISKIAEVGRGPGEYLSIQSLGIDKGRDVICVLDDMQQKIIRYNYSGKLLNECVFEQTTIVRSFACLDDRYILFSPDYLSYARDGVWTIDTLGNFVEEFKIVDPKFQFFSSPIPYYSCYDDRHISFYDIDTHEVYSITDDLVCEYRFDFKQKLLDEYQKSDEAVFTKEGKLRGTGDCYLIDKISECEDYFYFEFSSNFQPKMYVLFEKKSERLIITKSLKNDFDNSNSTNDILSYDKDALAVIQWHEKKNPSLQLLYMKKSLK